MQLLLDVPQYFTTKRLLLGRLNDLIQACAGEIAVKGLHHFLVLFDQEHYPLVLRTLLGQLPVLRAPLGYVRAI